MASLPPEILIFGLTLLGVAALHKHALPIAAAGLAAIVLYKLGGPGFAAGPGLSGFAAHFGHEWVTLANLLGLLVGFALIAQHFELSGVPLVLPRYLPDDWTGGFALLCIVFVISSFLDNIAAALIGGAMAHALFRGRVHIGYLAGIVAASNAGGSGSVVGDTTTTMMWIEGVGPSEVLHAYIAAIVALVFFGILASRRQHVHGPILKDPPAGVRVDSVRLCIVFGVLAAAIATNVIVSTRFAAAAAHFPFLGAAVVAATFAAAPLRRPDTHVLPSTLKGALFLICLVSAASLMPLDTLPPPSAASALALGFVSAVFDNIPLTALALRQGGYDWGMLAYAVGFGGSMLWFGSSAGVALSALYPEARSTGAWLRHGWPVAVAYVLGFAALYLTLGWRP